MTKINYSAFSKSSENPYQAPTGAKGKWSPWALLYLPLLPVAGIIILLVMVLLANFLMIAIPVAIVGLLIWFSINGTPFQRQMKKFAAHNNWQTGQESPVIPLFDRINYTSSKSLVSGRLNGYEFWLYQADPPAKSHNDAPVYLLSVRLPVSDMPNLLLAPGLGLAAGLMDIVAKDFELYPIELEGGFSKKARFYAEKGAQINALEYMTPDVMAQVEDKVKSIVIYSGSYIAVSVSDLYDGAQVGQLFNDIQVILKETTEKLHIPTEVTS